MMRLTAPTDAVAFVALPVALLAFALERVVVPSLAIEVRTTFSPASIVDYN